MENKEILKPGIEQAGKQENLSGGLVDIRSEKNVAVPKEVESWLQKIEKDPTVPKNINDGVTGTPMIQTAAPADPKIVLPVSRKSFSNGFKAAIVEAHRWLSEFLFRLIKIKKGKVVFKEE